jgi:hypothetical protein
LPRVSSVLVSSPRGTARRPPPTTRHLPRTRESAAMGWALACVKSRSAQTCTSATFGCSPGKTQRGAGRLSECARRVAPNRAHSSAATKRDDPIRRCRDVCRMAWSKSASPSKTTMDAGILFGPATTPRRVVWPRRRGAPAHTA